MGTLNAAHIHLLFNHFPITGGLMVLAVLAWGWLKRNDTLIRVASGLFVVIALLTVVAYLSGEPAERVLRDVTGSVPRELVHEHEEAGEFTFILYGVLGLLSLFTLIRYARREIPRALRGVLLAVALVAVGSAVRVGFLGGEIRHEEVRAGVVLPADSNAEGD